MTSLLYRPTRADMLDGSRLHHLGAICSRRSVTSVCAVAVAYGVVVYAVTRPAADALMLSLGFMTAVAAIALILLTLRQLVLPRLVVRRQFKEQRNLKGEYTVTWGERGFAVRGDTGMSDLAWEHYFRWRENARVILLYQSRHAYQAVPKRLLPSGAADFIRGRLQSAGVPKARTFLS